MICESSQNKYLINNLQQHQNNIITQSSSEIDSTQNSTGMSIEEDDEEEEKILNNEKIKKIKKNKKKQSQSDSALSIISNYRTQRQCFVKIDKPLLQQLVFFFTGHVIVELFEGSETEQILQQNMVPISISQVEKRENFFSIKPSFESISVEYDKAIYLLERKQNLEDYELAQMVKKYKEITRQQTDQIQKIKDFYFYDNEMLSNLQIQRGNFRNDKINKFIQENMQEDDFYFCFDLGINFQQNWSMPQILKASKNMFAVFGVDDEYIHSYLVKRDTMLTFIPTQSRKLITQGVIKLQIEKYNASTKNSIQLKNLEINTLDNIKLYCDVDIFRIEINYPKHLQYQSNEGSNFNIEDASFLKFNINISHLQQLISQRSIHGNVSQFEDIEYSVLSQIFVEKYYKNELNQMKEQKKEEVIIPEQQPEIEVYQKSCGYKYI